jgi:hypothetical protein
VFTVEVNVLTEEVLHVLAEVQRAVNPRAMALPFTQKLREDFQRQIAEAFTDEGPGWHALSDMRVLKRGGSEHPILQFSGLFKDEVSRYKGRIALRETNLEYEFPGRQEASGQYFGLAGGQLVNPWGLTPLARFPRPLLKGTERQTRTAIVALAEYFTDQGWEVEVL